MTLWTGLGAPNPAATVEAGGRIGAAGPRSVQVRSRTLRKSTDRENSSRSAQRPADTSWIGDRPPLSRGPEDGHSCVAQTNGASASLRSLRSRISLQPLRLLRA